MNFIHNIKKGDIILTDVGSAVVMRETRAKWFWLLANCKFRFIKRRSNKNNILFSLPTSIVEYVDWFNN